MFNVGPAELLAILVLTLVVLGPSRLPHALRTAGQVVARGRRMYESLQNDLRATLEVPDDEVEVEVDAEAQPSP